MTVQADIQNFSMLSPLSICYCGHTGDGGNSQHRDTFQRGHGHCNVPGCDCIKFTWKDWTPLVKEQFGL